MRQDKTFNDLIKTDPNRAAGILQDQFIHVVNNMIPGIYLNKDEYHQLIKIILAGEAKCPHEDAAGSEDGGSTGEGSTTDPEVTEPADGDDSTDTE